METLSCPSCRAALTDAASFCPNCGTPTPTDSGHRSARLGTFVGTPRFHVLERIGAGGMGAVYTAHDRERDEVVALKSLLWADAAAIHRLKKEFRALADVAHPNLVNLYELVAHDQHWFYTMELVEGVNIIEYVRRDGLSADRLRWVMQQLADGVATIHAAGKLHRDLKPPNVLVTRDGRVVILDMGICADLAVVEQGVQTVEDGVFGTVPYMAPEQADGTATPASDWYACGVILYEALTGQLPFQGSTLKILVEKQALDAPSPATVDPDLPEDLVALSVDLLKREPEARPSGPQVLERLGVARRAWPRADTAQEAPRTIVGREHELEELERAFAAVGPGAPIRVSVHGPSGIGKSALVEHFVRRCGDAGAVVLPGRCYEREDVPYKGLDGVIDSLTRFFRTLAGDEIEPLITRDIVALARIFPVLDRVETIADLPEGHPVVGDPVQLRRRAFTALRTLLGRIAARHRLILYIDDLQWADADSIGLLNGLLTPPDPPGLLLIVGFRSDEAETSPFLRSWLGDSTDGSLRALSLGPLSDAATRGLVHELLGTQAPLLSRHADAIVRESAGSPFLAEQMARHAAVTASQDRSVTVGLREMLRVRLEHLPRAARTLLEVLAVAARPTDTSVARIAASVTEDERPLVALLRTEFLVRTAGAPSSAEPYHDRIREAVVEQLEPERLTAIHEGLATAMERHGVDDPEALFEHWLGAGQRSQAAVHAAHAAQRANAALAFGRAITFYQRALDLAPPESPDRPSLEVGLGDALANAGRGPEAARIYLDAAENADDAEALELRRRAGEQLLRSGHLDHGVHVLSGVIESVGLRFARTRMHALLRTLLRRIWIRVRGLGFRERDLSPRRQGSIVQKVDVCWAVAVGLARIDHIRAADFQTQHLLLVLQLGEPYRVARALSVEATFQSIRGSASEQRVRDVLERTQDLARRTGHPHASGTYHLARGIAGFYTGHFAEAREQCEIAERALREQCTGVAWEIVTAQTYYLSALGYLGEFGELARRVPVIMREAVEHGDLYAAADVGGGRSSLAWLVRNDVDGARDAFRYAVGPGSVRGFTSQLLVNLLAQGQIDLYAGDPQVVRSRLDAAWGDLRRAILLRIQVSRIEAWHLRARGAVASAAISRSGREDLLESAERDARRIEREGQTWAIPLAQLIRAGCAAVRSEGDGAATLLSRAATGFEAVGMAGYAAAARLCWGQLTGGDAGAARVAEAERWMTAEGVVDPERLTAMLAPGFQT